MSYTGERGRKLITSFPKRILWVCVKGNEKGRRKKEGDRVDILSTSGVGGIRKKKGVWLEWGRGSLQVHTLSQKLVCLGQTLVRMPCAYVGSRNVDKD